MVGIYPLTFPLSIQEFLSGSEGKYSLLCPEPITMHLLATGLIEVTGTARRRMKNQV